MDDDLQLVCEEDRNDGENEEGYVILEGECNNISLCELGGDSD